jgi:hypothetical protein
MTVVVRSRSGRIELQREDALDPEFVQWLRRVTERYHRAFQALADQ